MFNFMKKAAEKDDKEKRKREKKERKDVKKRDRSSMSAEELLRLDEVSARESPAGNSRGDPRCREYLSFPAFSHPRVANERKSERGRTIFPDAPRRSFGREPCRNACALGYRARPMTMWVCALILLVIHESHVDIDISRLDYISRFYSR